MCIPCSNILYIKYIYIKNIFYIYECMTYGNIELSSKDINW